MDLTNRSGSVRINEQEISSRTERKMIRACVFLSKQLRDDIPGSRCGSAVTSASLGCGRRPQHVDNPEHRHFGIPDP
jgi:hypothetical protein